jgi:hypothetical protein
MGIQLIHTAKWIKNLTIIVEVERIKDFSNHLSREVFLSHDKYLGCFLITNL